MDALGVDVQVPTDTLTPVIDEHDVEAALYKAYN